VLVSFGNASEVVVVVHGLLDVLISLVSESWANSVWDKLENEVPDECKSTNSKTESPLLTSKTSNMNLHGERSELHDEVLAENNNDPDSNEHWVGVHSGEDVDLILNLSSSEHVKDLEHDEKIEHNREVTRWSIVVERLVQLLSFEVSHHSVQDVLTVPVLNLWKSVSSEHSWSETDVGISFGVEWAFDSFWDEVWTSEDEQEGEE